MKRIYSLAVLLLFVFATSAQQNKQLMILQTSDTHSRIESINTAAADTYAGMGGVVRRASFIKQYRSEHPGMLLFDCGDISQGTPYYNMFQGELEFKMMNLMKYDAIVIGNHEFDFGLDNMARLFRMAEFHVLCSNYDVKGTVLEGLVKPYFIFEREGLKVGVFGLSPVLEGLVQADKCVGIVFNDPIEVAQEMADLLKFEKECDVVVCLSHLGIYADEKLVGKTEHIDVVLGGHTHTFMEKPVNYPDAAGKNVSVFHTGKNGVFVGEQVLTLTKKK